ncbi:hypothetical protein SO802_013633 [Lithocarpus litseifolius]|uniref:Uncharacterized protein n=1 Tax=Lithocarpus litseifolius TaxID=425828 RepID=A0AAW2D6P8_9ROSI
MDLLKQYCLLAVPHFEKMLYDQGQIASLYLSSFSITTDVFYSCVSWDIFDYLRREVIGQEGEIFSAEDADSAEYEGASRKKEGAFCVWTSKEVDDILGQHAMIFKNHFYIKPMANRALSRMSDPHHEFKGKNVLFGRHNPAEMASKLGMPLEQYLDILGECRKKAFEVRSSRPRPHLDDKRVVVFVEVGVFGCNLMHWSSDSAIGGFSVLITARAVRNRILKDANGDISGHLRNHIHLTNCIHLKNHLHKNSPILADRSLMRDLVVLQRSRSLRDPSASPSSWHSPSIVDLLPKKGENDARIWEGRSIGI